MRSDEAVDAVDAEDDADDNVTPLSVSASSTDRPDPRTQSRTGRSTGKDRVRMSGKERREQLLDVGRRLFAEKGFEAVTVEEIAAKAGVSKPVVYEHFGGKEGLYAVLVDREMSYLLDSISGALVDTADAHRVPARVLLERAGMALFDYIERYPDGFRILVRDTPIGGDSEMRIASTGGTFAGLLVDVAARVDDLLATQFKAHGISTKWAPLYSQMLVGMVAQTGQWWLDVRKPRKEEVVAHLVNLAWNGLGQLEAKPRRVGR